MSQYLGDISAYALAVSQGYTGTEEEYAELMASYATVGQTAVTAAQTATTKASEAATSATTATNKASEATTAATTATNKAAEAQAGADAAALDASQAMSAASTATTKATEATTAAATAVSAKDDAVAANTAAQSAKTAAQTAQTGAETAAASVSASAAQIATNTEDITQLKSELTAYISGIENVEFETIPNEYVKMDGSVEAFSGWSRTDYIPVTPGDTLYYSWSVTSLYNCFYDADKNKIGSNIFMSNGNNKSFTVITGAAYIRLSNTSAAMASLIIYKGIKKTDTPVIVMVDKIVALQNEQFDIHYDNILANNTADDIPYKESFGSYRGVGMEDLVRIQSSVVEEKKGSMCVANVVPNAFNVGYLPPDFVIKPFTVSTISTTTGSGASRKVLLIGDSWTAPGKYALELQNLFASADEPMNITLLGTLGTDGAYVGAENGYHEGHGGYSAKTFCTKDTFNTYANAFYNPTSQTFDFAYYMSNCGYSSVDDVFINLGINDVEETQDYNEILTYWDIMVNSIKSYNSNVKVFIGLCGLPAQYKYSTNNNNSNRVKALRLMFHKKLMEHYGNKESDGIIIVPLHLSIDNKHDFPSTQMARSFRDSTLVDYCTDNVHPSDIAYNKIADRIRTYIKYAETL